MKRNISLLLLIVLFAFSGCKKTEQLPTETNAALPDTSVQETTVSTQPPAETTVPITAATQMPLSAVFVPAVTETEYADDETVIFSYTHQSMSLVLQDPDVADKIILDFLNRVDTTAGTAQELLASAKNAYTTSDNWVPYMCKVLYEPMRMDQSVLSLFGASSSYAGGIHPDHLGVSASYDLLTGDVLTLASIMHKDATMDMFCDLLLDELAEMEESYYLFDGYTSTVQRRFATDGSQDEAFYFTPTGLCFYFSPYEIAPYSSGTIIAEIPYEKLVGVIHDAYFPGESNLTGGMVASAAFQDVDLDSMNQICEAILTPGAQMIMLTADSTVENIRIAFYSDDPKYDSYVFFAASSLSPGDGIMLEATQEQIINNIQVNYDNSNGRQFLSFSG